MGNRKIRTRHIHGVLEDEVEKVEAVESVESEDMVETKVASAAPLRFAFLSKWTEQRFMSHMKYVSSYVVLQS